MTSKELYKRFIGLCERWPKDELKVGRDYGEYFRNRLVKKFPHGQQTSLENPKDLDLKLAALERIANNTYYNENPLKRSSSTGLESWACSESISNEGIRSIERYEETSVINRLKESLKYSFTLMNRKNVEKKKKDNN